MLLAKHLLGVVFTQRIGNMKSIPVAVFVTFSLGAALQAEPVIKLTPWSPPPHANHAFGMGSAVAAAGDYLISGAPGEGAGTAYIYYRSATGWVTQARLQSPSPTNEPSGYGFGSAVAIDNNRAVVGAGTVAWEGRAYVYARSGTTWSLAATLSPPRLVPDRTSSPVFGAVVAVEGDFVAIGATQEYEYDYTGASGVVYVYRRMAEQWELVASLRPLEDAELYRFGRGVEISGGLLGVLAEIQTPARPTPVWEAQKRNAIYLYEWTGMKWQGKARLNPSLPDMGGTPFRGWSMTTNTVLLGAPGGTNAGGLGTGLAHVFHRPAGGWGTPLVQTESATIEPPAGEHADGFGYSASVEGDVAVVGFGGGWSVRPPCLFLRTNGVWSYDSELTPWDWCRSASGFGRCVDQANGRVLVGSPYAYNEHNEMLGAAYVFLPTLPNPPFCPNPPSGAGNVDFSDSLTWSNGMRTTSLDLYFNLGDVPTNRVWNNVVPAESYAPVLQANRRYCWQVVCRNAAGVIEGPVWRFSSWGLAGFEISLTNLPFGGVLTNTVSAPRTFVVSNPGALPASLTLSLTNSAFWMRPQAEGAPTGFVSQLKFSLDFGESNLVSVVFVPTNVIAYNDTLLLRTGDGEWDELTNRIALSGEGLRSVAGAPVNPVPPNGATGVALRPSLRWRNGSGTDTIDLRFGASAGHMGYLLRDVAPVTNYNDLTELVFDTEYAWQVRCGNPAGDTPGPVWTFRTTPPPQFTLIAPAGGEIWRVGTAHPIQWKADYASATVRLELWTVEPSAQFVALIADATPNDGEFSWAVDPHIPPDRFYRVRVRDAGYTNYFGQSPASFTLTPTIHVVYPNGGEEVRAGAPCNLTWLGEGLGGDVRLDILQNGSDYLRLGRAPNSGSCVWDVPCDLEAKNLKARVVWLSDESLNDSSDATFDVVNLPPDRASNPSPADRAENVSRTPMLTWTNGAGACEVEVWLGLINPPDERLYSGGLTNSFPITRALRAESAYYWRVVSRNRAGSTNGPVWRFMTAAALQAPRLTAPVRNGNHLEFQWTPFQAGMQYRLQCTTNLGSAFADVAIVQTNRFTHTNGATLPTRFYRLRAEPNP